MKFLRETPFLLSVVSLIRTSPQFRCSYHPEFEIDFATAFIENMRELGLKGEEIALAISSLQQPNDRTFVADWINESLMANT